MKKYIAPEVKCINILSEGSLMALSNELHDTVSSCGVDASNHRESASSSIWGE